MKAKSVGGTGKSIEACCLNWRLARLLILTACLTCPAWAGPFQLVSVLDHSQGAPAGGSGDSWAPVVSADGRSILFASTANNLVLTSTTNPIPALLPPKLNVFLRDRTNATTTLV